MVGSAKSCDIIGNLIKLQLVLLFVCFHSLLSVHLLNFLARSCKILQIRGFLGKNLGKILTKKFRNIQDSYQEMQELSHWVASLKGPLPIFSALRDFVSIFFRKGLLSTFLMFCDRSFENSKRVPLLVRQRKFDPTFRILCTVKECLAF